MIKIIDDSFKKKHETIDGRTILLDHASVVDAFMCYGPDPGFPCFRGVLQYGVSLDDETFRDAGSLYYERLFIQKKQIEEEWETADVDMNFLSECHFLEMLHYGAEMVLRHTGKFGHGAIIIKELDKPKVTVIDEPLQPVITEPTVEPEVAEPDIPELPKTVESSRDARAWELVAHTGKYEGRLDVLLSSMVENLESKHTPIGSVTTMPLGNKEGGREGELSYKRIN